MIRRLPPLNALRAFEAAARLGSFARAGEELHVTSTAISHQVKGLEEFLGVTLFDRLPRGLRLTAQGRSYLPELTKGFDQLARASDRLCGSELRGPLHITTIPSFGRQWLVPRLGHFRRRYPEIDIRVTATVRRVDFIADEIDVGIRYGQGVYPGLRTHRVMTEHVLPVAAPTLLSNGPRLSDWGDLRHHTLLHGRGMRDTETWTRWKNWLGLFGLGDVDTERGLHFDEGGMLVKACVDGLGVALGRTGLIGDHLRDGRLVALFNISRPADYAYYVVAPESIADQPKVRAFVDWVVEMGARTMPYTPDEQNDLSAPDFTAVPDP